MKTTPGRLAYEDEQRKYWAMVERGAPRRAGNEEPWEKIGHAARRGWELIALDRQRQGRVGYDVG